MQRSPITDYLNRRALSAPWLVEGTQRRDFSATVVIPALNEGESLWSTLDSLAANPAICLERTLVLVVVNQREDATSAIRQGNRDDLLRLRREAAKSPLQLSWVDAVSAGLELPNKGGGVGLARKIGFDLALPLLDLSQPNPFLVSLDADTLVGPDYLPALYAHFQTSSSGGAVLPFEHQPGGSAAEQRAIDRYELFLRHYVLGLKLAGSPYAFHSIGSALACRAEAYAKAGGMNRRTAGEDFYFLQQLTKTTGVTPLQGTRVYPSSRPSTRTPFGTGCSVARQLAGETDVVSFYHPSCFRILGCWLQQVSSRPSRDSESLLQAAVTIHPDLANHLLSIDFAGIWERLRRNHPRPEALLKAFHDWFDGLSSLRLLHALSSDQRPRCQPEEALPPLLHWAGIEVASDLSEQLRILRRHQQEPPNR